MTQETLSQLRERLDKLDKERTQGNWCANYENNRGFVVREECSGYRGFVCGNHLIWVQDAYFIAAAPDMMKFIRELEAQKKELVEALEFYADVADYKAPNTGGLGKLYFDCGVTARNALARIRSDEWRV